jgi:type IX secretion system PorP/SprF family membrane protein
MKNSLLIFSCFASVSLFGQQLGLNSTYMFNEASYNPAAAGSKDYIPVHVKYRTQWVGFDGAPVSQFISTHSDMGKGLGFGGNIYNESSGPSRTTGLSLMLSYRLRLSQNNLHGLRFGLGASFNQHFIDVSRLTTEIQNDQTIEKTYNNQFVPDADLGIFYTYSDKAFFGISVKNVAQLNRSLFYYQDLLTNTLNRHYYVNGGYNFTLNEKWRLKTSVLARMIEAKTFQIEGNMIGEFNKRLFFGMGYRNKESINAILGMKIGIVQFGYSYDFGISQIRKYGASSHEVFVQLQFLKNSTKKSPSTKIPWVKRNRIYN